MGEKVEDAMCQGAWRERVHWRLARCIPPAYMLARVVCEEGMATNMGRYSDLSWARVWCVVTPILRKRELDENGDDKRATWTVSPKGVFA